MGPYHMYLGHGTRPGSYPGSHQCVRRLRHRDYSIGKSGTAKFGQSYLTNATRRQFGKFEQLDSDLLWLAQIIVNSLQLDRICDE